MRKTLFMEHGNGQVTFPILPPAQVLVKMPSVYVIDLMLLPPVPNLWFHFQHGSIPCVSFLRRTADNQQ